jgi:hypothetical protein
MQRVLVVGALIVGVVLTAPVGAAEGSSVAACSLLNTDDIAGVTGGKVGEGHENTTPIPSGPQKGESMAGCMWKLGDQGMVTVNVLPAATGAAREAGLAKLRQVKEKLKSQGWKEDKQTFGSTVCATLTPPPSQKSMPVAAGCMGEAKGMAVSVGSMSPGSAVPLPKMKALFDKATSRLP